MADMIGLERGGVWRGVVFMKESAGEEELAMVSWEGKGVAIYRVEGGRRKRREGGTESSGK